MNRKRGFFTRLALINIKSNSRAYIPYILTSIATIMVFYIMGFIATNDALKTMHGGQVLSAILALGMIVVGFFSVIFLIYTNSFLMKRRRKEVGLYNILGMEKRHIMKVLFIETVLTSCLSLVAGLLLGVIMSKLILLLLLRMISFKVVFGFSISTFSMLVSVALFGSIYILALLNNLRHIQLTQPVELLRDSQAGEREPKSKWFLTLLGVLTLGGGYYIAQTTDKPLAALNMFFIAVILVIIGTHFMFTAGSIFALKLLRKNKRYYYQTKHFTSVSGLIYRMKQNAAGLANICILSTIVLVMISTTSSLYIGMEDAAKARYPKSIQILNRSASEQQAMELGKRVLERAAELGANPYDIIGYRYQYFVLEQKGNSFLAGRKTSMYDSGMASVYCMTLQEYNRIQNTDAKLSKNQVFVYCPEASLDDGPLSLGDRTYDIAGRLDSLKVNKDSDAALLDYYYIILPEESDIQQLYHKIHPKEKFELEYVFGFDTDISGEKQIALVEELGKLAKKTLPGSFAEGRKAMFNQYLELYGGLLFIGIFLGALFIMATVMIIYYKQISEGYDDRERFEIMRKVGMSRTEVRKSIRSQVLTVFFLPLVVAGIHIVFAFRLITKMLLVLGLTNVSLFAACTAVVVLIFAAFYVFIYAMTAKTYYKIVS